MASNISRENVTMKTTVNQQTDIRIVDVLKKLAIQWKAVILAAILFAVIVGGFKYYRDTKAYESAKANAAEVARINALPPDERIAEILAPFTEDEKKAILHVSSLQEWTEIQATELRDSLVMQTDPTNQRVLLLAYSVDNTEPDIEEKLIKEYELFIYGSEVTSAVKPLFDEKIDDKYINEIINYPGVNEAAIQNKEDSDVLVFSVILLEDTDAEAVEKAITKELTAQSARIQSSLGSHTIRLVGSEVAYVLNQRAVDSRSNMYGNISNLKNIAENERNKLSEAQQVALDSINKNKAGVEKYDSVVTEAAEAEIPAPSISKKYVLLGFVVGLVLYSLLYAVVLVLKGCVNTSEDAEGITGTRSLGELIYPGKRTGIRRLLNSPIVEKILFGDKIANEASLEKIATNVESVCHHNDINELALVNMTGDISELVDAISKKDICVHVINALDSFNEESIVNEKAGVTVVCNSTKAADLGSVARTCRDYDINMMGNIYIGEL